LKLAQRWQKKTTALVGNLFLTSLVLSLLAVTGGPAVLGAMFLSTIVNKLTNISRKLSKNKKYINKIMAPAIMLVAFTGLMVVTSTLLAVIAVTGLPAVLGAMFLSTIVNKLIRVSRKLSRSSRHIRKSILPAIMLVAFTGLMVVSTALLAVIGVLGIPAILGSVLLLGIIGINVLAFKMLKRAKKNILIGSLAMAIMSGALILFGIALGKIAESTKDISWKQFGMIAALTGLFGVVVALLGITAVAVMILLGSVALAAMGGALIVFGIALGKVYENTKDISWGQFGMIAALTGLFAVSFALMGILSPLILLGSLAVLPMGGALIVFSMGIGKMVKETKDLTFMNALIVAGSIVVLGLATAVVGILSPLVILGSLALLAMGGALIVFSKSITKMIEGTKDLTFTNALIVAGSIVVLSLVTALVGLLSPFIILGSLALLAASVSLAVFSVALSEISSSTEDVKFMNILCFAGSLAILALITAGAGLLSFLIVPGAETIDSMATSLSKCVKSIVDISNAGKDINTDNIDNFVDALSTLAWAVGKKQLGSWFIEGGSEGIDVMINTLSKFADVMKKINEMKDIQESKIDKICNSMESICSFFKKMSLNRKAKKKSKMFIEVLNEFKKISKILNKIKNDGELPTESYIDNLTKIVKKIFSFYDDKEINAKNKVIEKSENIKRIIYNFTKMSKRLYKTFSRMNDINEASINIDTIISKCKSIINYYSEPISLKMNKVKRINKIIKSFGKTAKYLKQKVGNFSEVDSKGIESSLSSMRSILNFLRNDTLDKLERNKAKKNIKLLDDMSHTMSGVAKIDSAGISSVGNALSTTLGEVHSIDISQVQAVTNMFNAFNGINKSENILNKFTKSVNEFTEACKNLMEAMGLNTDAINNMESDSDTDSVKNPFNGGGNGGNINSVIEKTTADDGSETRGIRISNVDEIARNIANQINGVLSIDIPDTQIQLLINGSGGNEWIITRY
jgi:hypothetical protein